MIKFNYNKLFSNRLSLWIDVNTYKTEDGIRKYFLSGWFGALRTITKDEYELYIYGLTYPVPSNDSDIE